MSHAARPAAGRAGTAGALGEHLRSRRAQVTPDKVGLPAGTGHRRVPGLRREEVALLAGVSVDYYVRLEQGRERSPSAQVLDALATALGLRDDARRHLFDLADVRVPASARGATARVEPALAELMDSWDHTPALVYNRAYDVLAANELASELFRGWEGSRNLMHLVFLDPTARTFYRDWDAVALDSVAGFRAHLGRAPSDPRMREVLTELHEASTDFAELWVRHEVRGKSLTTKQLIHPDVGELELAMQAFDVRSGSGQELVVYHAEPGSRSAAALRLLGSVAATRRTVRESADLDS